jgi:alpha-glucosidase
VRSQDVAVLCATLLAAAAPTAALGSHSRPAVRGAEIRVQRPTASLHPTLQSEGDRPSHDATPRQATAVRVPADRRNDRRPEAQSSAPAESPLALSSPDTHITFALSLRSENRLAYRVSLHGRPVVDSSRLGIVVDDTNLGDGVSIGTVERGHHDERYRTRGVHQTASNRYNSATVALTHVASGTPYSLEVRAFDDAVAFRYVVPARPGVAAGRVPDEATVFNLPAGSTVWYHDMDGHYEGVYARRDVADTAEGDWAAPPLTVQLPDGGGYASITEAALVNYAGMALQVDRRGGFAARLGHAVPASYPYRLRYPALDVMRLAVPARIAGTITTPWRVIVAGLDLNTLVNSDAIANLSAPPDASLFPDGLDSSWIKPGRAVWRYLDGGDNTFDGIKEFSNLAGRLGFEYQVVEGLWRRWTDEQLRELVGFSSERHVGVLLWLHSRDLASAAARRALFQRLHDMKIAGVKIDFLDHEAKEVIDLYQAILRDAAEFHLMVDFHGANKPAGESRTWPNEMTREAVAGLERRSMPSWAVHNTTLPFTRFIAGAADYTPVIFSARRGETSWAHQIATAVVFTSPLLVFGANPKSLLENPAVDVIKSLPSVWDETIVLPGSRIGELAAYARRTGDTWFIGVLNGAAGRTIRLDLRFLGVGPYAATLVRDDAGNPAAEHVEQIRVTRQDPLTVALRPAGGFVARLVPPRPSRGAVPRTRP